ncbi:nuclear transport factor 2 family protein [Streptomyces sp. ISL-112]|uniref:YybH family protein n=1 Tax=unclassified Streptomyces TaxID=2593676 RepID=UPI001BEB0F9F|nr:MULTISPECIES: nuclear transport factor 2 family protein [unclassified Streptomyces]MBT2426314.1 nuclear transport factor 2 family protein [Streptomyces sp. ISL-112]MBT2465832.1 nuclear transport factor 2 family protein [Streptomyces sp. ISL-63]
MSTLDLTLTDDPHQQNDVFTEAFNSGEGAIFDQLYRADAISNLTGQTLTGEARTRAITEFLATGPKLTATVQRTFRTGDTMLLIVDFSVETTGPDGTPEKLDGTCTDVLVRGADGRWIMAIDRPVIKSPAA